MSNTQQLVIAALRNELDVYDLTLVQDADWANTGTMYAVAADGSLQPVGERLNYSFDQNGWAFTRPHQPTPAVSCRANAGTAPWAYSDPDQAVTKVALILSGNSIDTDTEEAQQ